MKKVLLASAAISTLTASGAFAQAVTPGVDLAGFTSVISFAGVTTALVAVASIVVVPELYMKGIKWVLGLVKGA